MKVIFTVLSTQKSALKIVPTHSVCETLFASFEHVLYVSVHFASPMYFQNEMLNYYFVCKNRAFVCFNLERVYRCECRHVHLKLNFFPQMQFSMIKRGTSFNIFYLGKLYCASITTLINSSHT